MARPAPIGLVGIACVVNLGLAGLCLVAAGRTGSAIPTAAAIQVLAVAISQALVLRALALESVAAASKSRLDIAFWAVVVPVMLFALAAGIAIDRGIARLGVALPASDRLLAYGPLAAGWMAEAVLAARLAQRFEVSGEAGSPGRGTRRLTGSALYALLLQTLAAIAGFAVALIGMGLHMELGWPASDAVTSIAIGLVTGAVAALMAIETRLLIRDPAELDQRKGATERPSAPELAAKPENSARSGSSRKRRGRR